jgi:hypothetical protein
MPFISIPSTYSSRMASPVGEPAAHRHLVRHQVRDVDADPRQSAGLGNGSDHRHRAIGAHRQHTVDAQVCRRLKDCGDVREVDDTRNVGLLQAQRIPIAIDGRHAKPELLRPLDRASLVAPSADEEHRPFHGTRTLLRGSLLFMAVTVAAWGSKASESSSPAAQVS